MRWPTGATLTGTGTVGAVTLAGEQHPQQHRHADDRRHHGQRHRQTRSAAASFTGAITQNASSALTVNGIAGNDSLANLATLTGTGTVGMVTLAGNNTLSSAGTLTTGGITVNGTGNTIIKRHRLGQHHPERATPPDRQRHRQRQRCDGQRRHLERHRHDRHGLARR